MAAQDKWFSSLFCRQPAAALPDWIPRPLSQASQFWRVSSLLGGIVLASAGLYAITRPCVIGPCPLLAQPVGHTAGLLAPTATSEDVVEAYDLVLEAIAALSHIPVWSSRHATAQSHLQLYTAQADELAKLMAALQHGREAAIASQHAPHSLDVWRSVEQDWKRAIAELNRVPAGTSGFHVAQRKLQEYENNQAAIARRIALEQQAQTRVSEARQAAALAEARASRARSAEDWQYVQVTWQVVLDRLAEVDGQTMAHAEAQQLEALYSPLHQLADEQQRQEQRSTAVYQQSKTLARQAESFEEQGQWSLAVAHWQQALQQVRQVPEDTLYYDRAQPLVSAYTKSLERSLQGFQISSTVQTSRSDVDQACQRSELCQVTAASHAIQVWVTDVYRQAVDQAIRDRSSGAPATVEKPVQYLVQSMAALGTAVQVPIEFYDGAGLLMGTYQPDTASYRLPAEPALAWVAP